MKTIGLIGGMSWESTVTYYQVINETVKKALGGYHSAKCILYSVDFSKIEACQRSGDWDRTAEILTQAAQSLEKAGADFIVICTNTMHKVAAQIQSGITVPLLHIADVTADELEQNGIKTAAFLGTRYSMEENFLSKILEGRGIRVMVPEPEDRRKVNDIIFGELCLGTIREESRRTLLNVIARLGDKGAQGAILGCTELGLLVKDGDSSLPVFDTTLLHARKAALEAIS